MYSKKFILVAALCIAMSSMSSQAQSIPPEWYGEESRLRPEEIKTELVVPAKVAWTSDEGVTNVDYLLRNRNTQSMLGHAGMCGMISQGANTASIILDYGKELQGGIELVFGSSKPLETSVVRLRFGESVSETCAELVGNEAGATATNDHAMRDMTLTVPRDGRIVVGDTGFRFLRIDLITKDVQTYIKNAFATFKFREIEYKGAFKCSDPLLSRIWDTGAYTVHLNMQEFLWDGIKRDRLVWVGDMHPEVATIHTVFGDQDIVRNSLDYACWMYPIPAWLNGMPAYSLWYLIIQNDLFMYSGNVDFLKSHWGYMCGVIDLVSSRVDANGVETLGSRFLDWPSSPNTAGVEAGFRALIALSMNAAANICKYAAQEGFENALEYEVKCNEVDKRIRKKILDPKGLKQAAALMSLAGMMAPEKAAEIIKKDGVKGFSTFFGYYMLKALALARDTDTANIMMKEFWGGMYDLGATTFWEEYDPEMSKNSFRIDEMPVAGKKDPHGDFGDYCYKGYRRSLCHGWASGPTAYLTECVVGITVVEPGCKKIQIRPRLGANLNRVEAIYPTPYGNVYVKCYKRPDGALHYEGSGPKEVEIVH